MHVACGNGLVYKLNTSGFVDDVMFSYHGAYGPESSTTLGLYFEEVRQWRGTSCWTFTSHFIILYICLSSKSIFYLINLFNFTLGCGLPTHIKAIFDLI